MDDLRQVVIVSPPLARGPVVPPTSAGQLLAVGDLVFHDMDQTAIAAGDVQCTLLGIKDDGFAGFELVVGAHDPYWGVSVSG